MDLLDARGKGAKYVRLMADRNRRAGRDHDDVPRHAAGCPKGRLMARSSTAEELGMLPKK